MLFQTPTSGLPSGSSSSYFHSGYATLYLVTVASLPSTFLLCLHDGQRYSPVFLSAPPLIQPRHFFFVSPTNVVRSFLHPSFFYDQLLHHMLVLVCPRFVGIPSQHFAWIGSGRTPSTPHTRVWLPLYQQTILTFFKSIFFTSCGQTTLVSTATCPSKKRGCAIAATSCQDSEPRR